MAVRSVKSVSSSQSEVMSWFWPISPVKTWRSLRQFDRILQNVSQKAATSYQIVLRFLCLFSSQKLLLFLQVVSAPSPDVLKEDELSSMTTYSVPKISFSSLSFEMNTEKKLDLLLMAYIPVCGWRMSRSLPFPCLSSGAASKSLVLLLEAGADNWWCVIWQRVAFCISLPHPAIFELPLPAFFSPASRTSPTPYSFGLSPPAPPTHELLIRKTFQDYVSLSLSKFYPYSHLHPPALPPPTDTMNNSNTRKSTPESGSRNCKKIIFDEIIYEMNHILNCGYEVK